MASKEKGQQKKPTKAHEQRNPSGGGEKRKRTTTCNPLSLSPEQAHQPVQGKVRENHANPPKKKKKKKSRKTPAKPTANVLAVKEGDDDDEFDAVVYVAKMKYPHLQYLASSVGKDLPFSNGRGAAPKARAYVIKLFASNNPPKPLTYAELEHALGKNPGSGGGGGEGGGETGQESAFMPSKTFQGSRQGYVFKLGSKGKGYYADDADDAGTSSPSTVQPDAAAAEEDGGTEGTKLDEMGETDDLRDTGEGTVVKKKHRVAGARGVSWVDLVVGNGPQKPIKGRFALIRYVARLKDADGPIFDSSEESQQSQPTYQNTVKKKPAKPARLKLGSGKHRNNPPWAFKYGKDQVIVGLEIGMKTMWEGGRRIIQIPWTVGYGRVGTRKVPGETDMSFEVELVGIGS